MLAKDHQRAQELHNLAEHAHAAAAASHNKGDHLTAHELTKEAHEHSRNALKLYEEPGQTLSAEHHQGQFGKQDQP